MSLAVRRGVFTACKKRRGTHRDRATTALSCTVEIDPTSLKWSRKGGAKKKKALAPLLTLGKIHQKGLREREEGVTAFFFRPPYGRTAGVSFTRKKGHDIRKGA